MRNKLFKTVILVALLLSSCTSMKDVTVEKLTYSHDTVASVDTSSIIQESTQGDVIDTNAHQPELSTPVEYLVRKNTETANPRYDDNIYTTPIRITNTTAIKPNNRIVVDTSSVLNHVIKNNYKYKQ